MVSSAFHEAFAKFCVLFLLSGMTPVLKKTNIAQMTDPNWTRELLLIADHTKRLEKIGDSLKEFKTEIRSRNKYLYTFELLAFYKKAFSNITKSVYVCSAHENIYAVNILYRSLIEHYARFMYLYWKTSGVDSDEPAKEYYEQLTLSEILDLKSYTDEAGKILGRSVPSEDELWDQIQKDSPGTTRVKRSEVRTKMGEVSFRKIISYLANHSLAMTHLEPVAMKLYDYQTKSSFVHGGVFAWQALKEYWETWPMVKHDCEEISLNAFILLTEMEIKQAYLIEALLPNALKVTDQMFENGKELVAKLEN